MMMIAGGNLVTILRRSPRTLTRIMSGASKSTLATSRLDINARADLVKLSSGINIATKTWGQASSARKAIALHGFLDNTETFDVLGPALAKEGFEVVAMDFPGHGKSDHINKDSWYTVLHYPEYVIGIVRSLGWNHFTLVGHSMGGAVASLIAASFPELVERCVFLDIVGAHSVEPGNSPKLLRRCIEASLKKTLTTKAPKIYESFDAAVRQRMKPLATWEDLSFVAEEQAISYDSAARLVAGSSEPYGNDGRVKFTNDVRLWLPSPNYLDEESVLTYLKAIKCPCLVVRGKNGMVKDTKHFLERKAAFGASGGGVLRDVVVPGSHHLHLDDNTAPLVAEHVIAFLHEDVGSALPATAASKL